MRGILSFENVKWLFFDVGSTIMNEQAAYEHRMRDIAELANVSFEKVYEMALACYRQNKKGDLESAKAPGVKLPECCLISGPEIPRVYELE